MGRVVFGHLAFGVGMRRTDRVVFALCVAMIAFCVVYTINPAAPRYYPLEGVWRWGESDGAPSMGWYGRFAWGLLAGFGGYGLARAVIASSVRDRVTTLSPFALFILTTLGLVALAAAIASIIIHEYNRWLG